uniref:Secondary thiamine-phosphate synthase enzyme n=1 Tax=Candidatus Kentrum sp. FW TaxID=2126338 RepID=A0A450SAY6_9GAMM|nr:MAG: secondary thiamine-phosphate synthase enzyme [Candidatus Kentron sp. FW]VFJ56232.1 MAG: secondary thiamine-phosphate synthase enzyme [Candidatus Kentron sp. FW]
MRENHHYNCANTNTDKGATMHKAIQVNTNRREELVDITPQVQAAVKSSGVTNGLVNVYVRGATAAIMVQENWDDSVQTDVINFLAKTIPKGVWLHDQQDGNGDSHLKAGLVGPSESVPIIDGRLGLSTWQNLFLCEFDGPRRAREVVCTIVG